MPKLTPSKIARKFSTTACPFRITMSVHALRLKRNDSRSAGLFDLSGNGAPSLLASIQKHHTIKVETRPAQWSIEDRCCAWDETVCFDCTMARYKSGKIDTKLFKIHIYTEKKKKMASFEADLSFLGTPEGQDTRKLDLPNNDGYTLELSVSSTALDAQKQEIDGQGNRKYNRSQSTPNPTSTPTNSSSTFDTPGSNSHGHRHSEGSSGGAGAGAASMVGTPTTHTTTTPGTPGGHMTEVYKVVWAGGVAVRQGIELDSPMVCKLELHDEIVSHTMQCIA